MKNIGNDAFGEVANLQSVNFPRALISIRASFYDCKALQSVSFPEGLTSIGEQAFEDCTSLTSITFMGPPPTFGNDVFLNVSANGTIYYPEGQTADDYDVSGITNWTKTIYRAPAPKPVYGSADSLSSEYEYRNLRVKDIGIVVSGRFSDDVALKIGDSLPHSQGDCQACDDIRMRTTGAS